jgi:hypothetical protein
MRRSIVLVILFAVACGTNTGVQRLGDDTFKIFKQGSTGFVGSDKIRSDVELQASQYCAQQGKSMKVVNVITGQPPYIFGNFPKAEVQFKCVDPRELQLTGGNNDSGASQSAALGEVAISSNVANAEVSIDGKFIGNAPIAALKLTPGTHVFEVNARGYVRWNREVTVVQGSATRVLAELEPVK